MGNTSENITVPKGGALSEKQELLISRFHDGECSYISAFFARRLITRNPSAQSFLSELKEIRSKCVTLGNEPTGVDMWSRIEAQIDQEQRTQFYVGALRAPSGQEPLWQRINLRHATFGGLSGAAIASVVVMALARPQQIVSFSAPSAGPAAHNQLIQPAAITNSGSQMALYQTNQVRQQRSLEVDWMRANGSLKLIPDPSGSSTIIWVRPRSIPSNLRNPTPQIKPTPLDLVLKATPGVVYPQSQPKRPY